MHTAWLDAHAYQAAIAMLEAADPSFRPQGASPWSVANATGTQQLPASELPPGASWAHTQVRLRHAKPTVPLASTSLKAVNPILYRGMYAAVAYKPKRMSAADTITVGWSDQSTRFIYSTGGSMYRDDAARATLMAAMLTALGWPVEICHTPEGWYIQGSYDISILRGIPGEPSLNPEAVAITIPHPVPDLADVLYTAVRGCQGTILEGGYEVGTELRGRIPSAVTEGIACMEAAHHLEGGKGLYDLNAYLQVTDTAWVVAARDWITAGLDAVVQLGVYRGSNVVVRIQAQGFRIEYDGSPQLPVGFSS